ncbi:GTP-binding protein [Citrobacter rodentium]|jgi:Predicted GTPase|uniref:ATP binding protein n=2 Tax=Citrobacter rodentium TaxID=67825 RepID=D2TIT8_CITRI|nr:ATP/GTP-binding protein [Citrobacter rodentium]KIQ50979.1 ATP-binding protein [Citrobacter rodentium]QBY30442.1 ATP-binding protein [Citrobacter rodentium]UHO32188.1 ATP/GTP-binding protein [Citrobacter rodentium NBRC 105723 = DSM 16636]CBG90848.1 putative ATP binding protein [Citrobacter rodentium ICC168]HAT8012636.1 ATP-binding protein [Citrobacter rodentium NBRC 105723 = DSM 16636]
MRDFKVMFVGCSGSGKTTAITSVSEISTVTTDVTNSDRANYNKEVTTVGLDYGEVTLLGQDNILRLYGTPGQERFSFMWDILGKGTVGIIFLADNSRPDPLGEIRSYLNTFQPLFDKGNSVAIVGIVKTDIAPYPDKNSYEQLLRDMGLSLSVITVDARNPTSVLLLLRIMSRQLERSIINHQGAI